MCLFELFEIRNCAQYMARRIGICVRQRNKGVIECLLVERNSIAMKDLAFLFARRQQWNLHGPLA